MNKSNSDDQKKIAGFSGENKWGDNAELTTDRQIDGDDQKRGRQFFQEK